MEGKEKKKRHRELKEMVLRVYEELTGVPRSEVAVVCKVCRSLYERSGRICVLDVDTTEEEEGDMAGAEEFVDCIEGGSEEDCDLRDAVSEEPDGE